MKQINLIKIIYLVGISIMIVLLYFAPFIKMTPYGADEVIVSFNQLVNGGSPYLMSGSKLGNIAAMSAIALLIALFLPNYQKTEWPQIRVTLMTVIMLFVFVVAISFPLMQAFSLITGLVEAGTNLYKVSAAWGAYAVAYLGIGLAFFMVLTCIPAIRRRLGNVESLEITE